MTDLPAGPELDIAVAEAVGWPHWQPVNGQRGFPTATGTMHDEWEPSTNIAHAWEVAEKLKIGVLPAMGDVGWVAGFEGTGACSWPENYAVGMPEGLRTWAEAPTASHAICLAALKSVQS